ncbi:MAG TPA: SCE4755 family polysaccharide monooxygenase-like protein [Polyangia bacterium]
MKLSGFAFAVGACSLMVSSPALAHITMTFPMPRTQAGNGQQGPAPCGTLGARKPNMFRPGETITVKWTETIGHPGHFRLAFDNDGMDGFQDPTSFTDIQTVPVAPVMADGIFKHTNSPSNVMREFQVTFPNVTCQNCTLQLLQMMTDKPPFGPGGGDDFYRQCADIVLAGAPASGGDAGTDGPSADAGVSVDASGSGGSAGTGGNPGGSGGQAGVPVGGSGGGLGAGGAAAGGSGAGGGVASGGTSGSGGRGGNSATNGAGGSSSSMTSGGSSGGGCSVAAGSRATSTPILLVGMLLGLTGLARRRRRR